MNDDNWVSIRYRVDHFNVISNKNPDNLWVIVELMTVSCGAVLNHVYYQAFTYLKIKKLCEMSLAKYDKLIRQ